MLIVPTRVCKQWIVGIFCLSSLAFSASSWAEFSEDARVNITPQLTSIDTLHQGEKVTVMRDQRPDHTVVPLYAKTSRTCPPFCIQPIQLAEGVDTIGEVELLIYMERLGQGDTDLLLIDSRTPEWLVRGTIPGAVNIPWSKINPNLATPFEVSETDTFESILTDQFGVTQLTAGQWGFNEAKTLILFCNGIWCPQSPTNIKALLKMGYPPEKLKWYRGGMQDWVSLGFTTVKPQ